MTPSTNTAGAGVESLPSYDELLVREGFPPGSSWGLWGDGDRLGCLNLLTPERLAAGVACVRDHAVFPLDWKMELPSPPLFGRSRFEHVLHTGPTGSHDDELNGWNTQSSSQWDSFRHVRHPVHGHYGGLADEDHGMHHWARNGIAGRAVLADVDRWRTSIGRPLRHGEFDSFPASDVVAALEAQGTIVERGDILLVRTGWVRWYEGLTAQERTRVAELGGRVPSCGLDPGTATLRTLWDLHVAAIAADNAAVETLPVAGGRSPEETAILRDDPVRHDEFMIHAALLCLLGIPLGEMWDLEALAEACAADGRYECLLVAAPINLVGGAGSPANATALR
jgi:kynurenine formamidase